MEDPVEAGRRAVSLARRGGTEALDGTWAAVEVETLCIHGDGDRAARIGPSGPEGAGGRRHPGTVLRGPGTGRAGWSTAVTATVRPFGDRALLVEVDDVSAAHRLAALVESERAGGAAPAAVEEWVVGFGNLVVHLDPGSGSQDAVEVWLSGLASRIPEPATDRGRDRAGGKRVVIPVTFDGPDLGPVATALGTGPRAVVDALCGADLRVAFLGFAPGFPYLVGLPPGLASVPRRATPRPSVPAGSVALAGGFASVYPQATPGGWPILGRTSLPLFDRERPPYALLRAGDAVCFVEARGGPRCTRTGAGGDRRTPDLCCAIGVPPSPRWSSPAC